MRMRHGVRRTNGRCRASGTGGSHRTATANVHAGATVKGATYSAEAAGTTHAAAASSEALRPHRRNGEPRRLVTRVSGASETETSKTYRLAVELRAAFERRDWSGSAAARAGELTAPGRWLRSCYRGEELQSHGSVNSAADRAEPGDLPGRGRAHWRSGWGVWRGYQFGFICECADPTCSHGVRCRRLP